MKIISKEEKENIMLSRKEYIITLEFEGAVPTKDDVKKEFCKDVKCNEKLTVVRNIMSSFKSPIASSEIFVYSDEKAMERIESYLMHKKIEEKIQKEAEEAKKKEEAKAAEASKEKKDSAEEVKEESQDKEENGEK